MQARLLNAARAVWGTLSGSGAARIDGWSTHARWLLRPNATQASITYRDGPTFSVRPHSFDATVLHEVVSTDQYRLRGAALEGDVVDLGGNIGAFAVAAAYWHPRTRIITVEPEPANLTALQQNIARNGLRDRIIVERGVVAAQSGTVQLHLDGGNAGGHSLLADRAGGATIDVPATTLEQLFERHGITRCRLLKLDIEGAEYDVLYRAPRALLDRIDEIRMEYHHVGGQQSGTALAAYLREAGFQVERVRRIGLGYLRCRRVGH